MVVEAGSMSREDGAPQIWWDEEKAQRLLRNGGTASALLRLEVSVTPNDPLMDRIIELEAQIAGLKAAQDEPAEEAAEEPAEEPVKVARKPAAKKVAATPKRSAK